MPEQRQNNREAEEERQRSHNEGRGYDRCPAIIVTGFASTALTEVTRAAGALTSRSTRSGKETTLIEKVKSA
jgi:hypothetical protein